MTRDGFPRQKHMRELHQSSLRCSSPLQLRLLSFRLIRSLDSLGIHNVIIPSISKGHLPIRALASFPPRSAMLLHRSARIRAHSGLYP